jgi:anoctamin-10
MAMLNNVTEFPSDAFKILAHFRRPLPQRTDTIGPWLDCLSFLTWLSALTNSALVYLFRPRAGTASSVLSASSGKERAQVHEVLARALFMALAASHGYIVLRAGVRHVMERALWYGSPEKARLNAAAREVKERYLRSVEGVPGSAGVTPGISGLFEDDAAPAATGGMTPPLMSPIPKSSPGAPPTGEFWLFDEGVDEIRKGIKEA